jgi:serine/threonine-protein kinase
MSVVDLTGVSEGELLAGKYRIERVLGAGGMGVVVAAHHLDLDQRVAIKFLRPEVLVYEDAVQRFAREGRAAVKITSEHVARVTDVGKLANGAPYMVMEYLEGTDLAAWLTDHGVLPIPQVVDFVLQACEALAEAHALGIVHRDLKPSNLFVIRRPDGVLSVKVLDFGISKALGSMGLGGGGTLTQTGGLMGSPLYMSPEQMQSSRNVDARSDIWALGVILYELITGTRPFSGESIPELVLRVVHGAPPTLPRDVRPELPPALEQAILKCLERDRGSRYQSIGELSSALVAFGSPRARNSLERISGVLRGSVTPVTPGAPLTPTPAGQSGRGAAATATAAVWGEISATRRRSRWVVWAVLVAAAAGAVIVWRTTRRDNSAQLVSSADAELAAPPPLRAGTASPGVTPTPTVSPAPASLGVTSGQVRSEPAPAFVEDAPGSAPSAPAPTSTASSAAARRVQASAARQAPAAVDLHGTRPAHGSRPASTSTTPNTTSTSNTPTTPTTPSQTGDKNIFDARK